MKDPIISYRGATARLSELTGKRVSQLEQQQATRLVQYRGANGEANVAPHQKKTQVITYRGSSAEMEV